VNIADELQKLQNLHRSGALTDAEFAAAKAAVLAGETAGGDQAPDMNAHLEEIKLQNEVARLDREWELERERYMVSGRYGRREVPTRGASAIGGFLIVGFGILWTAFAATMGAPIFFPLFGIIFILAGVGMSIYSYTKAGEYEQAYQAYRRRRARLLGEEENPFRREE
jgi:Short C-terminal domain